MELLWGEAPLQPQEAPKAPRDLLRSGRSHPGSHFCSLERKSGLALTRLLHSHVPRQVGMSHSSGVRDERSRGKQALSSPGGLEKGLGCMEDKITSGMPPLALQVDGKSQGQPPEPPGMVTPLLPGGKKIIIKSLFADFFCRIDPSPSHQQLMRNQLQPFIPTLGSAGIPVLSKGKCASRRRCFWGKFSIKWYKGHVEGKPLCCVFTPGRLGTFRHCPQRGSGV